VPDRRLDGGGPEAWADLQRVAGGPGASRQEARGVGDGGGAGRQLRLDGRRGRLSLLAARSAEPDTSAARLSGARMRPCHPAGLDIGPSRRTAPLKDRKSASPFMVGRGQDDRRSSPVPQYGRWAVRQILQGRHLSGWDDDEPFRMTGGASPAAPRCAEGWW